MQNLEVRGFVKRERFQAAADTPTLRFTYDPLVSVCSTKAFKGMLPFHIPVNQWPAN